MKKGLIAPVLAAALALFSLACSETGSRDLNLGNCDYVVLPSIADSETYRTWTERDCLVRLSLPTDIVVDALNDGTAGGDPSPLSAFVLYKYIVSYRNITQNGENVPRVDVPEPFQANQQFLLGEGGTFPDTLELRPATVLQLSAKGQPPLNSDAFYFDRTDPRSGVVLEAEMVFWGYPAGQQQRECRGTMIFRFTIFDETDPIEQAAWCEAELMIEGG